MLTGLLNYLRLTAKARTGLSTTVAVCALLAALAAVVAFAFALLAAFIWLADRYSPLTAALVLAGGFLLLAILAALIALIAQRRNADDARQALAARTQSALLDPGMIGVVLQIGRAIGLRRIAPLLAAGFLAAALAKEWFRDRPADAADGPADDGNADDGDAAGDAER